MKHMSINLDFLGLWWSKDNIPESDLSLWVEIDKKGQEHVYPWDSQDCHVMVVSWK